jgi:choline-sulfatase
VYSRLAFALTFACILSCHGHSRSKSEPPATASGEPSASARPTSEKVDAGTPPARALNVIVIVIDSLRADVLRAGRRRNIAPELTALERRAVSYTRAYSISSTTARSVAPMFAGEYPSAMVRSGEYFTRWYPDNLFFAERLKQAGDRSLGVLAHAYFYPASGMSQGFDAWRVLPGTVLNDPDPKPSAERTTAEAKRLLSRYADPSGARHFFAYLHYIDPHADYLEHDDGPDYGEGPRDLYDEEVHYTDQWVGALVKWVERRPWGKDTAFVISADHGECFGEHRQWKHGYELWEELVHVPLLFVVPGAEPRQIDVPRSHIDLAPTLLELMGENADPPFRGKSLVGELHGQEPEPRPVVVDLPRDNLQDRRRAVIDGNDKLIARGDDDEWLLYDLERDPHEKKNLADSDPGRFERMKKLYLELSSHIEIEEVHGDTRLKNAPEGRRW